jgi:tripartite-type tricarboxylate transporter receptor subunit TctC
LQQKGDFQAAWIPFNGGRKAALALLGGNLDATVMTPSSSLAQIQDGKLRILAVSSAGRDEYFPSVPTFKEQGYDVSALLWRSIMVKKGTPQLIIEKLLSTMKKIEATAEWKKFMKANVQSPFPDITLEAMQKEVRDEVTSRREFLKKNGYIK